MTPWTRAALAATVAIAAAEAAALGFLLQRSKWQENAADTPVARGRRIAEAMGCFGCHGPGGVRPIANPGSRTGEVPDWSGGTWMMWNETETDVRGWIEFGHPPGRDPDPGALLKMPAYGSWLTADEMADVTAYVLAVAQFGSPSEARIAEGREIANRLGCFGCHGPEGRGGVPNPGSFKGYVPGWDGGDFDDLVRSDREFREWVEDGISERLRANPIAREILTRQAIRMPAYRELLAAGEIEVLWEYVCWMRANPRNGGSR